MKRNRIIRVAVTLMLSLIAGCSTTPSSRSSENANLAYDSLPKFSIVQGTIQDPDGSIDRMAGLPTPGMLVDAGGQMLAAAGVIPVNATITWWSGESRSTLHVTWMRSPTIMNGKGKVIWLGDQTERGFYLTFYTTTSSGHITSRPCKLLKADSDKGVPERVALLFQNANTK